MQNSVKKSKWTGAIVHIVSIIFTSILIGCSPSSILITPDYKYSNVEKNDLKRKNIEIADVIDKQSIPNNYIGTVPKYFLNTMMPTYLSIPVSEFVRDVLEKLIVLPPDSTNITPVTVFIDSFRLAGKGKLWSFLCQLRFAYPISPDSVTQVPVSVKKTGVNWFDSEGVLEDLIYEGMIECAKFFVDSIVDKNKIMYTIQDDLSRENKVIEKMAELQKPPPVIDEEKGIPSQYGVLLSYSRFTTPDMKKAYGGAVNGYFGILEWRGKYIGHEFLFGGSVSVGEPAIIDTGWTINRARLNFYTFAFSYSFLWRLTGADPWKEFTPYIGVGGGFNAGIENIYAEASRIINDEHKEILEDSDGLRGMAECHLQCGTIFRIYKKTRTKLDIRFIFSTKSTYGDLENEERLKEGLYKIMSRPDFRFTGFNIGLTIFINK